MNVKNIFDLIFVILFIIALIVAAYATNHQTKNKLLANIEKLAAAFVNQYENVDIDGNKKMTAVINSVEDVVKQGGHKVDDGLDAIIRAFAEKEVSKINTNKTQASAEKSIAEPFTNKETDNYQLGTAESTSDPAEDNVIDVEKDDGE